MYFNGEQRRYSTSTILGEAKAISNKRDIQKEEIQYIQWRIAFTAQAQSYPSKSNFNEYINRNAIFRMKTFDIFQWGIMQTQHKHNPTQAKAISFRKKNFNIYISMDN